MSSVAFALATKDDDAGIRRLLATSAMPGRIRVRFEREPDYFAGRAAMGPFTQVLVARDGARVVGVACRAVRPMYVNGIAEEVGYLGQLRVDAAYHGRHLVARGFRKLRELHGDGRARSYVTTIVEDNDQAEGVLVRRSRGAMPRYRFLDHLYTLAIPARGSRFSRGGAESAEGRPSSDAVAEFLRAHGPRRNLFPAEKPRGEVVAVDGGVASLQDQRSFKQTVIDGYSPTLRWIRPLYNLGARIPLPRPGSVLNHAYVTHFCVEKDDAAVALELLEAIRVRAALLNLDHVLAGFTGSDPLLEVARRVRPIEYRSRIYTVAWDAEDDLHDRIDSRPRALDIAAL